MNSQRLCDKEVVPTEEQIYTFLGAEAKQAWIELSRFAEQNYDHQPELNFGGKNYGWNVRYRRSGKTLFAMFPEKEGFTVLLVLGKKEIEAYTARMEEFGAYFKSVYEAAAQFHDGRWLWIKVHSIDELKDIEQMILIKKKPKKRG
ncbi:MULTISPECIES: DUF3788 domain-containing protein [Paenibacillus]|uniref:DUF3788 domain-containing protein n=1 Tax=Paenibacillus borealis TaxID=160799 RepID=A0ABX3H2W8_PAEBO|nr:DUF3788 domain-containing protein [Paenibacillus borealis]OMD41958.1 hypothetical protein BSK56_26145 [Paenibacillus borealis]